MCFTSCVGLFAFRGCLSYHFLRWQGKARHAVRKPDASFSIGATFCPGVLPALLLAAADVVFRFVSSFVFVSSVLTLVLRSLFCFVFPHYKLVPLPPHYDFVFRPFWLLCLGLCPVLFSSWLFVSSVSALVFRSLFYFVFPHYELVPRTSLCFFRLFWLLCLGLLCLGLFCFRSDFSFRPFRLLAAAWSDQCYVHRGTQGVTSQAARPPVIM